KTGGYGQNAENRDLPVKQDGRLRAKRGKQGFARKARR
ncbi:acetylglutamate kinase, partial [Lactobacillus ruminis]|nr:acetylglutamate kinase [Ligilactobacillus ruminis]